MARWKYYEEGHLADAGLVILKVLFRSNRQRTTHYLIRYTCCNREEERSHYQIRERARRFAQNCRRCACEGPKYFGERDGIGYDYASVVPPTWPVPKVKD